MERSGSDTRFWEKSRIVTERISAATNVTERCGLIEPLRKNRSVDIFSLRTHPWLFSILNNFDRGKNVTFSGLIREICYGMGRTAP